MRVLFLFRFLWYGLSVPQAPDIDYTVHTDPVDLLVLIGQQGDPVFRYRQVSALYDIVVAVDLPVHDELDLIVEKYAVLSLVEGFFLVGFVLFFLICIIFHAADHPRRYLWVYLPRSSWWGRFLLVLERHRHPPVEWYPFPSSLSPGRCRPLSPCNI